MTIGNPTFDVLQLSDEHHELREVLREPVQGGPRCRISAVGQEGANDLARATQRVEMLERGFPAPSVPDEPLPPATDGRQCVNAVQQRGAVAELFDDTQLFGHGGKDVFLVPLSYRRVSQSGNQATEP